MAALAPLQARLDAITAEMNNRGITLDRAGHRVRDTARPQFLSDLGTSGFVRDEKGARVRPMTPADMQAMHDSHYGANKRDEAIARGAAVRKVTTPADMQAVADAFWASRNQ